MVQHTNMGVIAIIIKLILGGKEFVHDSDIRILFKDATSPSFIKVVQWLLVAV